MGCNSSTPIKKTNNLPTVYVIGLNQYGEAGNGSTGKIYRLTGLDMKITVSSIQCGYGHTIFIDDENNYWVAGFNTNGECGIGKFSHLVKTPQQLAHFTNINRICTNVSSQTTFWITNKGRTYANGTNNKAQLGLTDNKNKNVNRPALIEALDDIAIVDVKSNDECTIAICSFCYSILAISEHWYKNTIIPQVILDLIRRFYSYNAVFYVGNVGGAIFGLSWKQMWCFDDMDIIQIGTGQTHSLYLSSDGRLWSAGRNSLGQIGNGYVGNSDRKPTIVRFHEKVKIIKIDCGYAHNLALGKNGRVYSWGLNKYRQCGIGKIADKMFVIRQPTPISGLNAYFVDNIKCGSVHSYARSKNMHFLWGSNSYNECLKLTDETKHSCVLEPWCINWTVKQFTKGHIKHVFLGYMNTKIIVKY